MYSTTPDEAHNQVVIIAITTALLALCWFLYILRIVSRKVLKTPLWVDDWFMFFCLLVCSGMSTLNYVGVAFGSGVHREHLPPAVYRKFQINLYIFMMSWALGVAVVKIGILLFYYRVFSVAAFRRHVIILGVAILVTSIAVFFTFMFQCSPIPRFWADTTDGYCIDQVIFYMTGGSLNILGDVLVLSLPIRRVWTLKASLSQRLALILLFALGGFVCITSIFRLTALNEIDPEDFSYTNVAGGLWSTVEVQVGFICANLPHARPLFLRWFMPWRAHTDSYGVSSGAGASGGSRARRDLRHSYFQEIGGTTLASKGDEAGMTDAYMKKDGTQTTHTESSHAPESVKDFELSLVTPWEVGSKQPPPPPPKNNGISVRTDVRVKVDDPENQRPPIRTSQRSLQGDSDSQETFLTHIVASRTSMNN